MLAHEGSRLEHIDSLRGIAILYVLLFHAYQHDFPMGYLGVDMFFVISGYFLFKGKLFQQETVWKASKAFITKKISRLIAPLTILVTLCLLACIFFEIPSELDTSLCTGAFALLGCSNLYMSMSTQNYFAPTTAYNPLMHTWYVSALLQIYLLYIIGNITLRKLSDNWKLLVLSIVFFVSLFCWGYPIIQKHTAVLPENFLLPFDYYSTLPRLWEVLAGGAINLMQRQRTDLICDRWKTFANIFAIALIILLPIQSGTVGRNIMTIVIVLSTMVFVSYGTEGTVRKIISCTRFATLGKISFSLYLVHMPLLAFYRAIPNAGICSDILLTVAILLAGIFFYVLIEKRRFPILTVIKGWSCALGTALVLVYFVPSSFLWKSSYAHYTSYEGWKLCDDPSYMLGLDVNVLPAYVGAARMSRSQETGSANEKLPIAQEHLLTIGHSGKASFLLIGDSHASMLYYGLHELGKTHDLHGLYMQTYIIPYYGWEQYQYKKCSPRCEALVAWLKLHPEIKTIVIAQNWKSRIHINGSFYPEEGYFHSLEEGRELYIKKLRDTGCRVIVVDQAAWVIPHRNAMRMSLPPFDEWSCDKQEYISQTRQTNSELEEMAKKGLCKVLNINKSLLEHEVLKCVENGEYLMYDSGHWSPVGSIKIVQKSQNIILELLGSGN